MVNKDEYKIGYTHTEYYTARQIWTKDVWKRVILRTDVLFPQISSPLLPNPPQPHFGDLSIQNLLYRELSVSRPLMELRSWSFTVIYA